MEKSFSESYKAAGVDITAGYKSVELMKQHIKRTLTSGAMSDIGGFGGLFDLKDEMCSEPILVSGTDGVGTKLKIAMLLDKHDTIGIDCVAMCVNDVICCGAKPLFFLDYIACGKNYPEKIASIVSGVAEGCVRAGCALIGGETAEHPGMMPEDDYDLAGFTVGIVNKPDVFDNKSVKAGDVIIALPSSGVHSNGFSLVRKVFDFDKRSGFPTIGVVYDKQENAVFNAIVRNGDFAKLQGVDLVSHPMNNDEIAAFQTLAANQLVETYENNELKGRAKEIAAGLNEESNPVVLLYKYKSVD